MHLKHINIACKDLSSSALFYIGLLELDVFSSVDGKIELCDGIVLMSIDEYMKANAINVLDYSKSDKVSLEFEILSFDKFLYRLYKIDYTIDYHIAVVNGSRIIKLLDPDGNTVIIKEADDKRAKMSYEPELMDNHTIETQFVNTIIFQKEK